MPLRRCNYITTISEKTKSEILSLVTCDSSKIKVIPNPVFELKKPLKIYPRNAEPVLLFIGTTANKNLHNLIPALFKLKVRLRIIGILKPEDVILLNKFRISYSNAWDLDDEEIQLEYLHADMLVFPSKYEGFGLPVVEAFQCGLPVLTSQIAPMSQIAAGAAIFVQPDSIVSIRRGVIAMLDKPIIALSLRQRGFDLVKQYAPINIASQYELIYDLVSSS